MSTQEQRNTVRALRATAGAAYTTAADAIVDAFVELAALDELCGSLRMSDRTDLTPVPMPRQPLSFNEWPWVGGAAYLRHNEFAPTLPASGELQRLIALRVQELIDNELT